MSVEDRISPQYKRSIISSSVGNIVEWYDFGLFTIFSPIFSVLFFPSEDIYTQLITTFSIFAIGFFCRPLGALIFGYLGDRRGRAKTLRLSILMISIPTLLIGLLPVYSQVGLLAPCILLLIRMWQGISIGGEYSGNIIYLAELAPKHYRGTFTALASMGSNIGILIAALVGMVTTTLLTNEQLISWGWRVPYLLSGILSLAIYYFRLQLKETEIFAWLKQNKQISKTPIRTIFTADLPQLLQTIGLVCAGTTFYYFVFVFLPIYFKEVLNYSTLVVSKLMVMFIGMMILLVPIGGLLCDKLGRKNMLIFNACFILVTVIFGFHFLMQNLFLFAVLLIFTIGSSLEQGTTPISIVENFPAPTRYSGISFGYNLGNGILGGTVPLICAWLVNQQHYSLAPAFYIAMWAFVTLLISVFFIKNYQYKSLKDAIK